MDGGGETQVKRARLAFVLLLATAPPWGASLIGGGPSQFTDVSASGPLDYAKLVIVIFAAWLAFAARIQRRLPVTTWALLGFAAAGAIGAQLGGSTTGVLRAVRFAVVVLAVTWAVGRIRLRIALQCVAAVAAVMAVAAVLAVAAGLQPLVSGGRLGGYLPALAPNVLASVLAAGMIALFSLWAHREERTARMLGGEVLLGVPLLLTGSRTALVAFVAAIAVILIRYLFASNGRMLVVSYLVAWVGVLIYGAATGGRVNFLASLFTRGGTATVDTTFTGRTAAWQVAADLNITELQHLFGQGLQIKQVIVPRGFTSQVVQGIDSSWWSAYVGAGQIGVALLIVALLAAAWTSIRTHAMGALAIVVAVAASSFTESSLSDISFALVLFVAAATAAQVERRPAPVSEPEAAAATTPRTIGVLRPTWAFGVYTAAAVTAAVLGLFAVVGY